MKTRALAEAEIGARGGLAALLAILLADELEQGFRFAAVIEEDASDRSVSAVGRIIGGDVEDLAAGHVAEEDAVLELRDRCRAVDDDAGGRGPVRQDRIAVVVLGDREDHGGIAARIGCIDAAATGVAEASLPDVPAEVRSSGHGAQLLDRVLADVGDVHGAVGRVPAEALRVADAEREDLTSCTGRSARRERIGGGDAVLFVGRVRAERIDAQDLAENGRGVLRHVHGVAAAAAIRVSDVEQSDVVIAGCCERIEGDVAAVVVAERLLQTEHHAGSGAVVGCRCRIVGCPLEEDGIV
jgi:hypothetical protein